MEKYNAEASRLGTELKAAREKNNLSIETVSAHLRIQPLYLTAIEEGKFDLLPTGFYRKMFIKEYCCLLGCAELFKEYEQLLERLEELKNAEKAAVAENPLKENVPGSALVKDTEYKPFNAKPLLISAAVLLLLAVGAIFLFRSDISSNAKGSSVMQLAGGTEVIVKEKEAEDKKKEQLAEEEAKRLAEERAKAEEAQLAAETPANMETGTAAAGTTSDGAAQPAENTPKEEKLAKNELYIAAPEQDITISVSQNKVPVYEGKIQKGKAMRFKVEGEFPMRVRYENPNKTEVTFGGVEFKPLHPSNQGRSRYYWSDGTVTFTANKNQR